MKLKMNDQAIARLKKYLADPDLYLLLIFDMSGCQCGMNGTPTIKLTRDKLLTDQTVEQDYFRVIINKNDIVFFEQEMTLKDLGHGFQLTSPAGILNPIIPNRHFEQGLLARTK
ncbi:iron-sulfur cluster biosynthesis family protein [Amphibacillus sediminis]|uniref:iron-sulfur cluster biosynthesis family protein n=1 Tax=Amphibacillus sediminis TaxID=360185 RepID=UPI0008309396|nr:iron-sulfur cluster biosynthesis family protein [Amphibacillus sediminis]